jgi:predicted Zn-dependent protease
LARAAPRVGARTAFATALARWPDSVDAAVGLANVDYAAHRLDAAEQVLRAALARHPQSVVVLNNLAQVVLDRGDPSAALKLVDEAIALGGPFNAAVLQTRAQIVARLPGTGR